ncbi:aldo/keto reductase [Aestuariimicrobium sp. T2.26MG-19.2B]|uniref:aldo/keto reductase n=1 Tax=Aestuariimicrobium sp. T2.26MG-19.2B TaxID=3040679 RepID=UPI00247770B5|nr:aldo/keto reductase [Aestuariimicrobium sp. T2.26MG-19.2B]CAI9406671.1 Aldo-keto reductase IolS [Aestuariimicrobium sp. T2.26MG-19.2B]
MTLAMRPLGSGPQVSIVGLGGNNFGRPGSATADRAGTDAVIGAAIDEGITLIDTADIYNDGRSEELIGQVLTPTRRAQVVVATKFGHQHATAPGADGWGAKGAADYINRAVDASLSRLGIDAIDLYQIHTPDPETPIVETLTALDGLVKAGKVRAIGHSQFTAEQVLEADRVAKEHGLTAFVSAQNQYSLMERDLEAADLPAMRQVGLGLLPFFPLASGLLTGKYRRDHVPTGTRLEQRPERLEAVDWDQLEDFRLLCERADVPMVQAAIGWLIAQPGVSSVIAGATRPEQVRANAAAGRRALEPEFLAQVDVLFR